MAVQIRLVPCLSDNYAVILHETDTGTTVLIDAPEPGPIEQVLEREKWKLTHMLITHKHSDHVQGIAALKKKYGAAVIGPSAEASDIPMIDTKVSGGDMVSVGNMKARVYDTPGHTAGHIVFWFEKEKLLFAGDTLFALGCGRCFEAPPATLWKSLLKIRDLPSDVKLYCGHEYTLSNARFSVTVDPNNETLRKRLAAIEKLRADGKPTLPSTMQEERETNPFLRADNPQVAEAVGMKGADPAAVFTELRERKNKS